MQIFVSWSKGTSLEYARFLRDWLPDVIQQVRPWVSAEDIEKGQRWVVELGEMLDASTEGLICVTAENQREPWLNFEAGALAKYLGHTAVRPILLGVEPTDVTGPLAQFQSTSATDRHDMLRLVTSLNSRCPNPLEARRLEAAFDRVWDRYLARAEELEEVALTAPEASDSRSADDMTREILERVRDMSRHEIAQMQNVRPMRRRRVSPSNTVYVDGTAHDRSVYHRAYGDGLILKSLPDTPTLDGSPTVLVDFNKHGLNVVRFEDLIYQHRLPFVDEGFDNEQVAE
jgi:hypothetical protein